MIENLEFDEFYQAVRAEINDDTADSLEEGYRIDRFTNFFINHLGDFGIISDARICSFDKTMGASRVISNAWDLDEDRLSLFITDFCDSEEIRSVTNQDVTKAIQRAARVYELAKKCNIDSIEPSSGEFAMLRTIKEAIEDINQLRIFFLTDGQLKKSGDVRAEYGNLPVYCSYWDIRRLYRLISSDREYESIVINFQERFEQNIHCISVSSDTDEYQGYLAIIPGNILASLYEEYGSRLMELNVRSFLQLRGKVNSGIRNTILKEPHRFLAYNNGVSITAEEIQTERTGTGDLIIKSIKGLQIVNGGQTVASIQRTKNNDRCKHLNNVFVQAKISVVTPNLAKELVPKISHYANTQNTINEADFSSNDPFHIAIEKLANSTWAPGEQSRWFYERARGQYEVARNRIAGTSAAKRRQFDEQTPKKQKFAKTDLAKYYNCWGQKPHIIGQGAQKNFSHFMSYIAEALPDSKPSSLFFKNLIARAIIYKAAEKVARKHKFPSYRANAVAYTVSLVAFKAKDHFNLTEIWDKQSISEELDRLIFDWMPVVWQQIIDTAGTRNVTEWAKKEDCWEKIKLLSLHIKTESKDLIEKKKESSRGEDSGKPKIDNNNARGEQNVTVIHEYEAWSNGDLWDPRDAPDIKLIVDGLVDIAKVEGPIYCKRLFKVYTTVGAGLGRTGSAVRGGLEKALRMAFREGKLISNPQFIRSIKDDLIIRLPELPAVKIRPLGKRSIDEVPSNELAEVVKLKSETVSFQNEELLFREVMEFYGQRKLTQNAITCLKKARRLLE